MWPQAVLSYCPNNLAQPARRRGSGCPVFYLEPGGEKRSTLAANQSTAKILLPLSSLIRALIHFTGRVSHGFHD